MKLVAFAAVAILALAGCSASVDPQKVAAGAFDQLKTDSGASGSLKSVHVTLSGSMGTVFAGTIDLQMDYYKSDSFQFKATLTSISSSSSEAASAIAGLQGISATLFCTPDRLVLQTSGLTGIPDAPEGLKDFDHETPNTAKVCRAEAKDAKEALVKAFAHLISAAAGMPDSADQMTSPPDLTADLPQFVLVAATKDGDNVKASYHLVVPDAFWNDVAKGPSGQAPPASGSFDTVKTTANDALKNMLFNVTISNGKISNIHMDSSVPVSIFTINVKVDVRFSYGTRAAAPSLHGTTVV